MTYSAQHSDAPFSLETLDGYLMHGLINIPAVTTNYLSRKSRLVVYPVLRESDLYSYKSMAVRDYFIDKGYDVLRISMSYSSPKARFYDDLTIGHIAADLRQLADTIKESYDESYIIAHGLASFATALSNADFDGQALLESCIAPYEDFVESSYAYRQSLGYYQSLKDPMDYMPQRLVESCKMFDRSNCHMMIESIDRPTQLIWAERGFGANYASLFKPYLKTHAQSTTVIGADHQFVDGHAFQRALETAFEWFTYCGHMYEISALGLTESTDKLPTYSVN